MLHEAFQALADPTRREILRLLKKREMSAGEISDRFLLAKSTLSSHFSVLRHAGLILAEKQGTTITYSLNVSAFEDVLAGVLELFKVGKPSARTPSARTPTARTPTARTLSARTLSARTLSARTPTARTKTARKKNPRNRTRSR
jgi:DNA-binding transcriptional ArsR family regulator